MKFKFFLTLALAVFTAAEVSAQNISVRGVVSSSTPHLCLSTEPTVVKLHFQWIFRQLPPARIENLFVKTINI